MVFAIFYVFLLDEYTAIENNQHKAMSIEYKGVQ